MWWINANTFGREWIRFCAHLAQKPKKAANNKKSLNQKNERKKHTHTNITQLRPQFQPRARPNAIMRTKMMVTVRNIELHWTRSRAPAHSDRDTQWMDRRRRRCGGEGNGFYDVTTITTTANQPNDTKIRSETEKRRKKKSEAKKENGGGEWQNAPPHNHHHDDNVMQRMRLIIFFMIFLSHLF